MVAKPTDEMVRIQIAMIMANVIDSNVKFGIADTLAFGF
jgi:hypothetical protein